MSSTKRKSSDGPLFEDQKGKTSEDEEKNVEFSKKAKLNFDKKMPTSSSSKTLSIKLGAPKAKAPPPVSNLKKASVFGDSDDEEVEEMPPEAKMRMKNIGRDTQTSSGPNSFGKTRQGFCDSNKLFERELKKVMEENSKE